MLCICGYVYNGSHTLSCDSYPHVDPAIKVGYVPVFNCSALAHTPCFKTMFYLDIVTMSGRNNPYS